MAQQQHCGVGGRRQLPPRVQPIPASTFAIKSVTHFPPTDDDGTVPLLEYAGDSDRTAREHIADACDTDHGEDDKTASTPNAGRAIT